MKASLHLPRGIRFYTDALEGLARVNTDLYREHKLPSIYSGRVRYRRESTEEWRPVTEVLADGWGDCEDLAAARVGELRASGEQGASVLVKRTGPQMTHALVKRADGTIEDPSRKLGMGRRERREEIGGTMPQYPGYDDMGAVPKKRTTPAPKRVINVGTVTRFSTFKSPVVKNVSTTLPPDAPDPHNIDAPYDDDRPDPFVRAPDIDEQFYGAEFGQGDEGDYEPESDWPVSDEDWEQIGADPTPDNSSLTFVVNRIPSGFQGVVRVPLDLGRALMVSRTAPTESGAKKSAMSAVSSVLESPLAKALIPPQAQMALKVLQSPVAQKAGAVALDVAKKLKFW
jgi:hypothetical protein